MASRTKFGKLPLHIFLRVSGCNPVQHFPGGIGSGARSHLRPLIYMTELTTAYAPIVWLTAFLGAAPTMSLLQSSQFSSKHN